MVKLLQGGQIWILFVDHTSGHKFTDAAFSFLHSTNTTLQFLPKNVTKLSPSAEYFIIKKVKTVWSRMWDETRMEMVQKDEWVVLMSGSGKLPNHGKMFYLNLASDVMQEVRIDRDEDGVLLSRNAIMGCGMHLNRNGRWEAQQHFPHFQAVISKFKEIFDGAPVSDSVKLDGKVTESENGDTVE